MISPGQNHFDSKSRDESATADAPRGGLTSSLLIVFLLMLYVIETAGVLYQLLSAANPPAAEQR